MRKDLRTGIEVSADAKEFTKAEAFVDELLAHASVSREIAHETKLTFETVFAVVLKQGVDSGTTLRISSETDSAAST